jgi:selenocysteine-specific elongation factor
MHVIATAGHVDHGKSALLRALTGMEPDRWEEERRRGLTIDLGFVWTDSSSGSIAFVDVPGHERFVGNMLAGVGPVPAVLFVVAADEGWMPQSAEHLLALHALGVRHGVLAVTKTDLMEPDLAAEEALEQLRQTSLGDLPWVGVSARTGAGLPELMRALDELVSRLPDSDPAAPIRLWVDRGFTIRGAGLVVTGTLAAGTVRPGDTLELARTGARFVVREVQALNQHVDAAVGVSRVALNLRGAGRGQLRRGDALMTPGTYRCTAVLDVRTRLCVPDDLPRELLVHVGTATVGCTVKPLGTDTARLTLETPVPLRVGDRVVLRSDRGVAGGAVALDVDPPALNRRGATRRRAADLVTYSDVPDALMELRRRGFVREGVLRAIGLPPPVPALVADWLVDPELAERLRTRLAAIVAQRMRDPSAAPLGVEDARKALELPDVRLVPALLAAPLPTTPSPTAPSPTTPSPTTPSPTTPLAIRNGVIVPAEAPDTLAPAVREALEVLEKRFAGGEFAILSEEDLAGLGLKAAEVSAASRAGRLVKVAPGVILLPDTIRHAVAVLATLPQPFTVSEARDALGTSRKVIVPLLEHLARDGATRRDTEGRHSVTGR